MQGQYLINCSIRDNKYQVRGPELFLLCVLAHISSMISLYEYCCCTKPIQRFACLWILENIFTYKLWTAKEKSFQKHCFNVDRIFGITWLLKIKTLSRLYIDRKYSPAYVTCVYCLGPRYFRAPLNSDSFGYPSICFDSKMLALYFGGLLPHKKFFDKPSISSISMICWVL